MCGSRIFSNLVTYRLVCICVWYRDRPSIYYWALLKMPMKETHDHDSNITAFAAYSNIYCVINIVQCIYKNNLHQTTGSESQPRKVELLQEHSKNAMTTVSIYI